MVWTKVSLLMSLLSNQVRSLAKIPNHSAQNWKDEGPLCVLVTAVSQAECYE